MTGREWDKTFKIKDLLGVVIHFGWDEFGSDEVHSTERQRNNEIKRQFRDRDR